MPDALMMNSVPWNVPRIVRLLNSADPSAAIDPPGYAGHEVG